MHKISGLPFLEEHPRGLVLTIFVQPKSSKNMIAGIHDRALKIKLTAPPVDGAANKMCIEFLAKQFRIPKSAIEMVSGHTGRNKRLLIQTEDPVIMARIRQELEKYGEEPNTP